jgi:hypothetical protein
MTLKSSVGPAARPAKQSFAAWVAKQELRDQARLLVPRLTAIRSRSNQPRLATPYIASSYPWT